MPFANVGIPMVCVTLPMMLVALFPIVFVESWVLRRVCSVPRTAAWRGTMSANLFSTLLGIPIAWFPLVVAQIAGGGGGAWGLETPMDRLAAVTLQAPWLIPYEKDLGWMIPAASLVLMTPFFLASVVTEYLVLRKRWGIQPNNLLRGVVLANALSYALLGAFYFVQLHLAWLGVT